AMKLQMSDCRSQIARRRAQNLQSNLQSEVCYLQFYRLRPSARSPWDSDRAGADRCSAGCACRGAGEAWGADVAWGADEAWGADGAWGALRGPASGALRGTAAPA